MKMQKNWLTKSGNQWEGWEVCEGGTKVKFCQPKMETWSCEYGFILLVNFMVFYAVEGDIYLEFMLGR